MSKLLKLKNNNKIKFTYYLGLWNKKTCLSLTSFVNNWCFLNELQPAIDLARTSNRFLYDFVQFAIYNQIFVTTYSISLKRIVWLSLPSFISATFSWSQVLHTCLNLIPSPTTISNHSLYCCSIKLLTLFVGFILLLISWVIFYSIKKFIQNFRHYSKYRVLQ